MPPFQFYSAACAVQTCLAVSRNPGGYGPALLYCEPLAVYGDDAWQC
jgi:hypothetical protein